MPLAYSSNASSKATGSHRTGSRRRACVNSAIPPRSYFKRIVTLPTAADNSAPTLGPLSSKITPLAFCN
jgi:hypothetical protein